MPDGGGDGAYGSPPGTLYSDVVNLTLPSAAEVKLLLSHEVAPVASPGCSGVLHDTEWIKTVRVDSALLKKLWGKSMRLEACVLLLYGFHDHPTAKYPLLVAHGHYSATFNPGGASSDRLRQPE